MALVVLAICCLSSSIGAGGFFGGMIPGTEPHFLKVTKAKEMKDIVKDLKKLINDYETQIQTLKNKVGLEKLSSRLDL